MPKILNSAAHTNQGALFILWDEGENNDGPIGMMRLSPLARGGGYSNSIHNTHSSFVRTMQEIFGVSPWLDDAANAPDLGDLFRQIIIQSVGSDSNSAFNLNITGIKPGSTNFVEASTDLITWKVIGANWNSSNSFSITDNTATNHPWQFYRVRQAQ